MLNYSTRLGRKDGHEVRETRTEWTQENKLASQNPRRQTFESVSFMVANLGHMGGLQDKLTPFTCTWLGMCRCQRSNLAGAKGTTSLNAVLHHQGEAADQQKCARAPTVLGLVPMSGV